MIRLRIKLRKQIWRHGNFVWMQRGVQAKDKPVILTSSVIDVDHEARNIQTRNSFLERNE